MSGWQWILSILMICVCCFLMLVILIQRGRGSGLAGAFGGAGGSSAFGAKTGDILTWVTVVVTFGFLVMAVVLNFEFDESPQPVAAVLPLDIPLEGETPPAQGDQAIKILPVDSPSAGREPADSGASKDVGDAGGETEGQPAPSAPDPTDAEETPENTGSGNSGDEGSPGS